MGGGGWEYFGRGYFERNLDDRGNYRGHMVSEIPLFDIEYAGQWVLLQLFLLYIS